MILRDFCRENLEKRDEIIKNNIKQLLEKYPGISIKYSFKEQYENMKKYVEKNPKPLKVAQEAIRKNGLEPKSTKIRGGTDGATFSKMGLVTPNLGTGSYNHHGRFEFLVIQEYEKMIQIVLDIVKL
jgi:tripeptide aminopeptidase